MFAAIGIFGLLASAVLLARGGDRRHRRRRLPSTLQVFGFFGIIVTSVIQMRVVAQILRRDDGGTNRRV